MLNPTVDYEEDFVDYHSLFKISNIENTVKKLNAGRVKLYFGECGYYSTFHVWIGSYFHLFQE